MKKQNYLLRRDFENWLILSGVSLNSLNNYTINDRFEETDFGFFEIAANFMLNGEPILAYTTLDLWNYLLNNSSLSPKSIQNKLSYWSKIYEYFSVKQTDLMGLNKPLSIDEKSLIEIRKRIEDLVKAHQDEIPYAQLNGMDHLLSYLPFDSFIKLAVESSYFFDPETVKRRFEKIIHVFQTEGTLPVRKSKLNPFYEGVSLEKDGNGNAKVCSLINNLFGYQLNKTLDQKPILNTIISHVWGNAIDPQYFTALWNIVLIPAWANHLMDKPSPKVGSLASKLQTTIKAMCLKLYKMDDLEWKWSELPMQECPSIGGAYLKDVLHGDYRLQVIQQKDNKSRMKMGRIKLVEIRI